MIVEQRIYRLKPGTLTQFLNGYEREGYALQREILGRLIGYYFTEIGELNTVVQLWGFDSYEDRLARKAKLSAMPEWREFVAKSGPLIEHQENILLNPALFYSSQCHD